MTCWRLRLAGLVVACCSVHAIINTASAMANGPISSGINATGITVNTTGKDLITTSGASKEQKWGDSGKWFMEMLALHETRLVWQTGGWHGTGTGGGNGGGGGGTGGTGGASNWSSSNESAACDGAPFLLTRSVSPNGVCPSRFTTMNASCTCIRLPTTATSLVFRVRQKELPAAADTEKETSKIPEQVQLNDGLTISSIGSLAIPTTLRSLEIHGELASSSSSPLGIPVGKGWRWGGNAGGQSAMISNTEGTNVTTVALVNLNLAAVSDTDEFFPSSVTNLTLRNCNIPGFNTALIKNLGNLVTLDLSSNNLSEPYERPQIERCVTGLCLLRSLNLSGNKFSSLPQSTAFFDSLDQLDLTGNPITNFTITSEVFARITALPSFLASSPSTDAPALDCSSTSSKQTTHSIDFCVVGASSSSSDTTSTTAATNANRLMLYSVLAGGLILVILLVVFMRQRGDSSGSSCKRGPKGSTTMTQGSHFPFTPGGDMATESAFDECFYNSGTATLFNDPIIITRRIEQSDIKMAHCLSKGGFGVVYSGVYRRRRRVAIKKIRPEYCTNTKMIETFLKEICLMATLRHERIVEFIGVAWETPRDICAVTELMEKGDVRDVLALQREKGKHNRKLPLVSWANGKKIQIALHVAEALAYLHGLQPKVIHRDLKAKNVLLNGKFEAKLSDFGISRERHLEETHMTAGVGTSFWIAPEVLLGRHDYDERADIYSFGVVLCEIDTEDYPFWTEHNPDRGNKAKEMAILRKVAAGTLRPQFSDTCPGKIMEIAMRCLETEPQDRPTAQELVELLTI